jgi:hypothetical protein
MRFIVTVGGSENVLIKIEFSGSFFNFSPIIGNLFWYGSGSVILGFHIAKSKRKASMIIKITFSVYGKNHDVRFGFIF